MPCQFVKGSYATGCYTNTTYHIGQNSDVVKLRMVNQCANNVGEETFGGKFAARIVYRKLHVHGRSEGVKYWKAGLAGLDSPKSPLFPGKNLCYMAVLENID